MTTLVLMRHGATEWTHSGRLQGSVDIDLSPAGVDEVQRMRPAIAALAPQAVITSPMARARSTAALLGHPAATVDSRWEEAGLGDWEGRYSDQLGDDYGRWRNGELAPPGGEPRSAVRERILSSVRSLGDRSPVLVVTHGGVIRSALDHFVGLRTSALVPVHPASITVLELAGGCGRLALYNWTPSSIAGVLAPLG